jgi:hypothetical protein
MTSPSDIAKTIVAQLGGRGRLTAMVNAKHFYSMEPMQGSGDIGGLTFQFSGCRKARVCHIWLEGSDTYRIELIKPATNRQIIEGKGDKVAFKQSMVYAESLKAIFEQQTGLCLSL